MKKMWNSFYKIKRPMLQRNLILFKMTYNYNEKIYWNKSKTKKNKTFSVISLYLIKLKRTWKLDWGGKTRT
jgi:hypothetical protein